jgi:hypothetical protein
MRKKPDTNLIPKKLVKQARKVGKLMSPKEAVILIAEVPHQWVVALLVSTQREAAKVTKVLKDHLPLRVEEEPMSSMLALANKATKIVNRG